MFFWGLDRGLFAVCNFGGLGDGTYPPQTTSRSGGFSQLMHPQSLENMERAQGTLTLRAQVPTYARSLGPKTDDEPELHNWVLEYYTLILFWFWVAIIAT